MTISIIAAMAKNRVIGCENKLPWNLPADLKRFKKLTLGHHIIMGRKTYESIGKPLPGRTSIIITRQENYKAPGCYVVNSIEDALKTASNDDEVFITGGEQVYKQTLNLAERLYLTLIGVDLKGDAYFPKFNEKDFELISRENHLRDKENPHPFSFLVYERKKTGI